jgi:hypothetical protein
MLSEAQLTEILERNAHSQDSVALVAEIKRLARLIVEHGARVEASLSSLESDMFRLEDENARLRSLRDSAYVERDACVSLLARLALAQGLDAGTHRTTSVSTTTASLPENRVVVDLPSGQVSWDFLDADSHLFEALPQYRKSVEALEIQEIYARVLNPGLAPHTPT